MEYSTGILSQPVFHSTCQGHQQTIARALRALVLLGLFSPCSLSHTALLHGAVIASTDPSIGDYSITDSERIIQGPILQLPRSVHRTVSVFVGGLVWVWWPRLQSWLSSVGSTRESTTGRSQIRDLGSPKLEPLSDDSPTTPNSHQGPLSPSDWTRILLCPLLHSRTPVSFLSL